MIDEHRQSLLNIVEWSITATTDRRIEQDVFSVGRAAEEIPTRSRQKCCGTSEINSGPVSLMVAYSLSPKSSDMPYLQAIAVNADGAIVDEVHGRHRSFPAATGAAEHQGLLHLASPYHPSLLGVKLDARAHLNEK